jgi:hypothetical protein
MTKPDRHLFTPDTGWTNPRSVRTSRKVTTCFQVHSTCTGAIYIFKLFVHFPCSRPRACGSRSRDGVFIWRHFPPIRLWEQESPWLQCHVIGSDSHLINRHVIHMGLLNSICTRWPKAIQLIITPDSYSGGSVFDSRPLRVPPTFHPCKCWSSHSWTPCVFRFHASIIIHSHRHMNPAGLTEVSLSEAKIKNTAEGMCLANGVQMVTLDCTIQCAITLKRLIVTPKLRK